MSTAAGPDSTWQGSFWLPQNASPMTGGQDALFYFIYGLSIFFFIVVVGFMLYFAVKYRKKSDNDKTTDIHGNTKLEIIWSIIPGLLFIVIFTWGFLDWIKLNVPPQGAIEMKVIGRKWDWSFIDPKTGAETSDLIVPVNKAVRLTMSSADVIHGFYVPDFRINRDVLPNQYTVLWFKAEKEGSYPILCTQYCGTKHSQMVRYVRALPEAEYEKTMIAAMGANLTPAELGKKIFAGKGACKSCHDNTPDKKKMVGPPLFGSYGHDQVVTRAGKEMTIKIDDNYLRKSIVDPNYDVVKGYGPIMPSYQGQLSDKEIDALIEYIKVLK